ncbi:hypothetical protein [Yoonia vestfoldensis]|uniref:hypothetical protein n=1 Tax=Yoonia vestfoldensis TaxID=245188 RepID=UPI0003641682|nr:hypothetical protein [Yoonia vestfoldensis]
MSAASIVTFYLHPKLRKQAEEGRHNFIALICKVLTGAGLSVAFDNDDDIARLRALARPGRGVFLMDRPVNDRSLTMRKTYIFPFWHIEKQAERWDWPVAEIAFDPGLVDDRKAANFCFLWQKRLFDDAVRETRNDGFVYVPLQGRLTVQRSFQHCSPINMIRTILRHDPKRPVMATLHPSEVYGPEDHQALETLMAENDRLYIRTGEPARYLRTCDYIVTQNSGVALQGFFFNKPAILFAKSDFHHIALNVGDIGAQATFGAVMRHTPDYAAYLYWFLQTQAINAGRPDAQDQIARVLRGHGWPV